MDKVASVVATRLQRAVDQDGECRNRVSTACCNLDVLSPEGTGEAWNAFLLKPKRRCALTGRTDARHAFWAACVQGTDGADKEVGLQGKLVVKWWAI
jgi:hypothetical protein